MSDEIGIAIDIGTSGIRAKAIDLGEKETISTAITLSHPLPGANVMDHLTFAIKKGRETANKLLIDAINDVLEELSVDLDKVIRLAVSGNPIQLSIFENIEIRDLAYAGEKALAKRNVSPPNRDKKTLKSEELGLKISSAEVLIPPAIKHEVGADALAMMVETGFLDEENPAIVTDYGTNAEMAIKVNDDIYTGSAAAGPAIEGQHIEFGMLASPGSINSVEKINKNNEVLWKNFVLDKEMVSKEGDLVNPSNKELSKEGEMHGEAKGVTGTGVVAAISQALEDDLIDRPNISTNDERIHLQDNIYITQKDYKEATKAFAAIRAGHLTLIEETNTDHEDLESMYMSGASGTYVDALKAHKVGLLPSTIKKIHQVGNTSLKLATKIVKHPDYLEELQEIANSIRAKHIMFAENETFENIFVQELAYWDEGMPWDMYETMIKKFGIQPPPQDVGEPKIVEQADKNIEDIGPGGISILEDPGQLLISYLDDCDECERCINICPEEAVTLKKENGEMKIEIETRKCLGSSCLKCQNECANNQIEIMEMKLE